MRACQRRAVLTKSGERTPPPPIRVSFIGILLAFTAMLSMSCVRRVPRDAVAPPGCGGGQPAADIAVAQAGLEWLAPDSIAGQEAGIEGIARAGGVDHLHRQGGGMPGLPAGMRIGALRAALTTTSGQNSARRAAALRWLFLAGELAGFALVGGKHVHQPERIRQTRLIQRGGDVLAVDEDTPAVLVDEFDEGPALGEQSKGGLTTQRGSLGGNGCLGWQAGKGSQ